MKKVLALHYRVCEYKLMNREEIEERVILFYESLAEKLSSLDDVVFGMVKSEKTNIRFVGDQKKYSHQENYFFHVARNLNENQEKLQEEVREILKCYIKNDNRGKLGLELEDTEVIDEEEFKKKYLFQG